ncbi:MAG: von Willebrand factor type A domain-containing protein [Planctomycetota bacterium]
MRTTGIVLSLVLMAGVAVGQNREQRRNLRAGGGSQKTETSKLGGITWLAKQQRPDGGWAAEAESAPGPTGLVLLAYLGAGYTDRGKQPHARAVRNGLRYLLQRQSQEGRIGATTVREHAIATLALAETYWMTRNPRLKQPVLRAIRWLEGTRKRGGAWSDDETTAWSVMAWKSAKYAGLPVDPTVAAAVMANWNARALTSKRAPLEVITRVLLGSDPATDARIRAAADLCLQSLPNPKAVDRIHWHFATLGLFQVGGRHWKAWNSAMKEAILGTQDREGWWQAVGKPEETYGKVGETALMTLCLQVYYRYDRVFGLSGGAGGGARGARGGRVMRVVLRSRRSSNSESYDRIDENPFRAVADHDTSTFSVDVDTASYANVRRHLLKEFTLPPKDAVRVEELINYFPYAYEGPATDSKHPFRAKVTVTDCPWKREHRLARIAVQARPMDLGQRPATNLTFLLDVSGSMSSADKLPLLQRAMALLVNTLSRRDRVSVVVYAGAAGLVLPPTSCEEKEVILEAIGRLQAGGSTAGGEGIELAYRVAAGSFIENGINRVVLCTDGDFNVGITDRGSLTRLIEQKAKSGVFLSVLGFGRGNLKDARMKDLAKRGNGNYAYIDSISEARKVLVKEMNGTLATVAKDVKIQVFFNPAKVAGYRLIGYENRLLAKEDFDDDKKDAGEIGAGHAVTALYEIVPAGTPVPDRKRNEENPFIARVVPAEKSEAMFRLRLRYKPPAGGASVLLEQDVKDTDAAFDKADPDLRWAAAVSQFGMLLTGSKHKGNATWDALIELAESAKGEDPHGYRAGFIKMAKAAKRLSAVQ